MSQSRQLAAILFTDIVGYTALMQENEQEAVALIKHYNAALNENVGLHNGKVLNYYGDGSLCSFPSVTEAMNCSIELQKELQEVPVVPLRIGLHVGEVFFENEKALGDGVNVASRIQSLGQANTILFSKEIADKIRNQPEFKSVSLGLFEFKNVNEPMEVFALANPGFAVPKREEMHGKLKLPKNKLNALKWVIAIALIAAASLLIFINDIKPEREISNDKIAVLKFEDFTGDENFDAIGEIAANLIIHAITENELAQVISPKVVNDYTSMMKSQASTLDSKNFLKTYFKPGKIISGTFYKENNKLLLQGSIIDGANDQVLISFETIKCDPSSPIDCVESLKQRILSYLSMEGMNMAGIKTAEETPPKYEALEYFLIAIQNYGDDTLHLEYLNKAINADPNYFDPKINKISYYYNLDEFQIADSLLKQVNINSKLSVRKQNILLFHESLLKGKYDKAYKAQKKEYEFAYLDLVTNMTTMTIALQFVNRPGDIDDIFNKEISMKDVVLEKCLLCGFRYYVKGLADVELKKYKQVIAELLPIIKTIEDGYLKRPLVMAYIRSGDYNALEDQFKLWELSMDKKELLALYLFTGNEFLLANKDDKAKIYFNKVINFNEQFKDPIDKANSFYFIKDYKTAQTLLENINADDPKNIDVVTKLAISNYKNGNSAEAEKLIKSLNTLRSNFQFGTVDYGYAQYYAVLNDKKNTFDYLLKSVAEGKLFTPTKFQNDPHFLKYKDTKEFKDILNYWNQFLEVEKPEIQ